jgi:Tfp pilus assembly protein FimV
VLDRATLYRRRRLVVLVVAVAALAAVAALVSVAIRTASEVGPSDPEPVGITDEAGAPSPGDVYVVKPGDTLWSIAVQIAPDSDPRAVVAELREANGGAVLQVGERLDLDVG